jgi:hypothetical protein
VSRVTAGLIGLVAAFLLTSPASAASPWQRLHRPLHLPQLAAGAACPVSPVDRHVDWDAVNGFGLGIGPGPVYPGLGADGHATTNASYTAGGWFGGKVFWYVKPSYRGRVLIRGRRLDGPESLRFNEGRHPSSELRIKPGQTVSWSGQPAGSRGVPSILRIHASGCYAAQIDGTSFSRIVVMTVSTPPP